METIEALVRQAKQGNKNALQELILTIQDRIYGLALRMLYHPADAEDATQEILVKIITHLNNFREESTFHTWVYRVACNHLLTTHRRRYERMEMSFKDYEEYIDKALSDEWSYSPLPVEQGLFVEETMIRCMQGILLCLDRDLRIAYILGEIFDISSDKGSDALRITPAAFRKRLERARTRIRNFMSKKCGLVNPKNSCRCSRHVQAAIKNGWINPDALLFAQHPYRNPREAVSSLQLQKMNQVCRIAALFRSYPDYAAPLTFIEWVQELLDSDNLRFFPSAVPKVRES